MNRTAHFVCPRPVRLPFRALLTTIAIAWAGLAAAAGQADVHLPVNRGTVINLPEGADNISAPAGSEQILETNLLDARHLYLRGKKLGATNIVLCTKGNCYKTLKLEVTHDLESLRAKLHEVFPGELPKIYSSNGAIVIAGQVSSVEKMNAILAIAGTYAVPDAEQMTQGGGGGGGGMGGGGMAGGGVGMTYDMNRRVINLMQIGGPQQVMLGVTVAEMSTSLARNLTVNFSAFGGGDIRGGAVDTSGLLNALNTAVDAAATTYNPAALFLRFAGSDATVRTFITAARENGLAKVLAEPNLTAISGQDAEFQSGGSFPVPVFNFGGGGGAAGAAGGANVIFKDYGVILKFLPVVLDTNRISLKVNITVSELSNENAVTLSAGENTNYTIPSLIQRGAVTTLELDSGQTMGIAGLINDRTRESIKKFPGLGDIPVLGQLFTSQQFQRAETELLILVTPQLAKPVNKDKLRLPTDEYVEPSDTEFYWMGRTESLVDSQDRPRNQQDNMGGLRGHFGPKIQNMRRDVTGN